MKADLSVGFFISMPMNTPSFVLRTQSAFVWVLLVYSALGAGYSLYMGLDNWPIAAYLVVFTLTPCLLARLISRGPHYWWLVSAVYFAALVVRPVTGVWWLQLQPPFSLGFPFGDFARGHGRIVDVFALGLSLWALLIYHGKQQTASP